MIEELEKLEKKYEIENIFDKYLEKAFNIFEKIRESKGDLLDKYNNKINELIKHELEEKIEKLFEDGLSKEIDDVIKNLDSEMGEHKIKLFSLFKIGLEKELEKGKYKTKIDFIQNFSFFETIKRKLLCLIGKDNAEKIKIISRVVTSSLLAIFGLYFLFATPAGIIGSIFFGVLLGVNFVINLFRSKEKVLLEKLDESQEKLEKNFSRMKIQFSRIYNRTLNETIDNFKGLLVLSLADLSHIEKEVWNELNEEYKKTKKEILEFLD